MSVTEIVRVPKRFNYQTMHTFTGAVVGSEGVPTGNDFVFSFDDLMFIDGSGLTVFASTLEWLISHGVTYSFADHVRPDSEPIAYLDDCGFFEQYTGHRVRRFASARRTTLPIMKVAHAEAFGWLEHKFTPWMAGVLAVDESALGSVKVCIKEVFNNIQDHSTKNCGFVHVQHYPNVDRVAVTMSDFW